MRAFRIGVVASALVLAGLLLTGQRWRDRRGIVGARLAAAVEAAEFVRMRVRGGWSAEQAAAAFERRRGYRVRVLAAGEVSPSLLDALRRDEAPRAMSARAGGAAGPGGGAPGGAVAPLKDADDWDVIGAVEAIPMAGVERQGGPWRPGLLGALAVIALAAWGLFAWSGRTGERRRRETVTAWGFLAPAALHLAVFSLAPIGFTVYLAFHRWSLAEAARPYVGLGNFRDLAGDELFWTTLRNTALYTLYVPITMAAALALALLLNRRRGGERVLRAVVFLPYLTSTVAIAIVWQWMMNPDFGLVNRLLGLAGLAPVDWLGSPKTALPAIILVTVWTQVGYQMVVFLAGLQSIPQSYYEAALVDGATPWGRFRHVTLPLLRPVVLFVLVTGVISGFQVFTLVYVMTEGGPLHATDVIVYRIYQTAWEFLRFGSASAMSLVLFAVLLAVTAVQFRLLGRRVEY